MEKPKEIEIHSEEVNDILSRPPAWILRWGITVVFVIVVAIFIGSIFFKYPDIITAPITISSTNLPVHLRAKTSGKIERFFVQEGDTVTGGIVIALIESTANYNDFLILKRLSNSMEADFPPHLNLGSMQLSYTQFLKSRSDYETFVDANYHIQKIALIRKQMLQHQEVLKQGQRQLSIFEEQYQIQKNIYERDSALFAQSLISKADIEQSKIKRLSTTQQYESLKSNITNIQLTLLQSEQMIFELTQEQKDKKILYENTLTGSFDILIAQMVQWEQTNLIISPIDGKVAFTKYWQNNQHINVGDLVLTIIPQDKVGHSGKLYLPLQGVGKVKVGQQVNIKLDHFPYMEFGMVEARITHISAIPIEVGNTKMIIADVNFPNGLTTNYKLPVESGEEMNGTADIITEDLSLFARFTNPIRHVFKSRI